MLLKYCCFNLLPCSRCIVKEMVVVCEPGLVVCFLRETKICSWLSTHGLFEGNKPQLYVVHTNQVSFLAQSSQGFGAYILVHLTYKLGLIVQKRE